MLDLFLIALAAFAVFRATRHDLAAGFPLAAGMLVFLPGDLRIELPGAIPEITVHRIILVVLLFRWIQAPKLERPPPVVAHSFILGLLLASRVISDLLTVTPVLSIKDLLNFVFETFVFFHLARYALASAPARVATMRAVAISLVGVAIISLVERYAGVSLPRVVFAQFKHLFDGIQSTYPHRILLGYAMAMGTPLVLLQLDTAATASRRRWWWLGLFAVVTGCFLADSRGGWIGMALGVTLTFVVGTGGTRRRCFALLGLAVLALLLRPGIRQTILSRVNDTYAGDTYKGVSYQYRWRLWNVAFSEVARSPQRLAFGYGGLSTETMDLSRYFRAQEGGTTTRIGYTSWDNHFASDLIEFGLVGLGFQICFYAVVLFHLARRGQTGSDAAKPLINAALISCVIFVFARTNVYIFGEQLKFLFWTVVVVGTTAAQVEFRPARAPADIALAHSAELVLK